MQMYGASVYNIYIMCMLLHVCTSVYLYTSGLHTEEGSLGLPQTNDYYNHSPHTPTLP